MCSSLRTPKQSQVLQNDANELKHKVSELEERFQQTMVNNAQLDKEKHCILYEIEMLKDEFEELEENYHRLQRDYKDKSRYYELLSRDFAKLQEEHSYLKECLRQREEVIAENGLLFIKNEESDCLKEEDTLNGDLNGFHEPQKALTNSMLITREAALVLSDIEGDTIEDKLKFCTKERKMLIEEVKRLRNEIEKERQNNKDSTGTYLMNGNETKSLETENSKLIHEYKFKLMEAEQERNNLQNIVARLETQVERLKRNAEESEKIENELKTEKRKVLRELREAQIRIEELETCNAHLAKRIDKFKSKCLATINS